MNLNVSWLVGNSQDSLVLKLNPLACSYYRVVMWQLVYTDLTTLRYVVLRSTGVTLVLLRLVILEYSYLIHYARVTTLVLVLPRWLAVGDLVASFVLLS